MSYKCRLCPSCKMMLYGLKCNCGYVEIKEFITVDDYFKCYTRNANHPSFGLDFRNVGPYKDDFTDQIFKNAIELLKKVNSLFTVLEDLSGSLIKLNLSSGWRPPSYNVEIGGARRSLHCTGQAIDIVDISNKKYNIIEARLEMLVGRDMAMEHKSATRSWLHLQSKLPKSGRHIFYP